MGIPVPISGHNEPLPPGELTTIQFNYEWRRLVTELLWPLTFDGFWTGTDADVTDAVSKARAMIEDLYTIETIGGTMDYLGVTVGRTLSFTVTTEIVGIDFQEDDAFPIHDVGNFWVAGDPSKLIVPVGGAGYYSCFGRAQVGAGAAQVQFRLLRGFSELIQNIVSDDVRFHVLQPRAIAFFEEGDFLMCDIRVLSGSRPLFGFATSLYAVQLGMYRLGLAP